MASKLEMIFKNQTDSKARITIDQPRSDLTQLEVETAMNDIIAKNVFNSNGGDFVAISGARVVTTQINDLI
ncbi:MAG: DUF2922 domain-containing protein [Firmicutes bacterium]|nr:DUF2922 domain-containing protein [Bacillota bacterium]